MKLIFKWLRPIESQQSTISGCKITSYFLNFQIFSRFSLGARKHWGYNCFPVEDITIYPLRISLFSPMPDIPNFLSYAYHLLSRPCPTANVGRSDVACGIVQPKTGICACALCGEGDGFSSTALRRKPCACEIVRAGNIIVGCNNNLGKIRQRAGDRAMKNETRCTENKLPSVRSTNNTGCPSGIGQPV